MSDEARYFIRTWDHGLQRWTPQPGVELGPYTLMGLRVGLRLLEGMGYCCRRSGDEGDPSVLVERYDDDEAELRQFIAEDYQNRKQAARERNKSYRAEKPTKKQKELFI